MTDHPEKFSGRVSPKTIRDEFASAVYQGRVRHRRYQPKSHKFEYNVFMLYLDLDELEQLFKTSVFWSQRHWSIARFRRKDFHGDTSMSVAEAVHQTVLQKTGLQLDGPVRVLANLSYFGFNMNPLTTYYCFDKNGEDLRAIVAEVTNTPWNERHAYVLSTHNSAKHFDTTFEKEFTVSPFHPLNMVYRWRSNKPGESLVIHIDNFIEENRVFDASLILKKRMIKSFTLDKFLLAHPFMTAKVFAGIYWQAFKLWVRGIPFLGKNATVQSH